MLFNKDNTGIDEIKRHIGYIYASNEFDNLLTDIELAQEEVQELISKEVYDRAHEHYHSDNYQSEESGSGSGSGSGSLLLLDQLVYHIQLPVALIAYKNYSPHGDLTHSDKGRQIIVTETEKPAFEWMVERDEEAIQKKINKTIDRLIRFMEAFNSTFTEWTSSEAHTLSRELFINTAADFDKIYPIDKSRGFFIRVLPFIREVERKHIIPVITSEQAEALKIKIKGNTTDDNDNVLLQYIRIPLVLLTMSIAARRLALDFLPDGIFEYPQFNPPSLKVRSSAPLEMKNSLVIHLENEGMSELKRLQEYLAKLEAEGNSGEYEPVDPTDRMDADNKYFRM